MDTDTAAQRHSGKISGMAEKRRLEKKDSDSKQEKWQKCQAPKLVC